MRVAARAAASDGSPGELGEPTAALSLSDTAQNLTAAHCQPMQQAEPSHPSSKKKPRKGRRREEGSSLHLPTKEFSSKAAPPVPPPPRLASFVDSTQALVRSPSATN
eukprot:RCo040152